MLKTVSSLGNFANVTITSTDSGAAAGPLLDLYRDSASPAASDTIGEIEFNGQDSAGNKQQYALIHGSILSPTSTTEQGQIHFETATAGASTEKMIIGTTNLVINDIGAVFNVRIEGDTDANLFYTDATNSRVGVGTVGPIAKLDVAGGDIRIDNGNLIIGTSGKGINFSATPGTGTSELLADYEEGTWTPTFVPATGAFTSITYASTGGYYTKVGRLVCVTGRLRTNGITVGTAAGSLFIGGLPFTSQSTTSAAQGGTLTVADPSGFTVNNPSFGFVSNGDTTILIQYRTTSNGGASDSNVTDLGTVGLANNLAFAAYYFTA